MKGFLYGWCEGFRLGRIEFDVFGRRNLGIVGFCVFIGGFIIVGRIFGIFDVGPG